MLKVNGLQRNEIKNLYHLLNMYLMAYLLRDSNVSKK